MAGCTGDLGGIQVVWVDTKQKPYDLLDTIIHESVHVYQHFLTHIGETSVGKESQAYGIAYIATTLVEELERQNAIHEGSEESAWESSVLATKSGGTTGLHAGSQSSMLPQEGGNSEMES